AKSFRVLRLDRRKRPARVAFDENLERVCADDPRAFDRSRASARGTAMRTEERDFGLRIADCGLCLCRWDGFLNRRFHPHNSRARDQTVSNMASVSLPVWVFCWLGWKEHSRAGVFSLK